MTELEHDNGLVLEVPPGLVARTTDGGFVIRPANAGEVRNPFELSVTLEQTATRGGVKRRVVKGREVSYTVSQSEGGSYGPQYVLSAWMILSGRTVALRFTTQGEDDAEPDFSLAWKLLEKATVRSAEP